MTRYLSKFYSGPLPPAEELEHFDRVLPGAADRIMAMAEREQNHRHQVESSFVRREFNLRGRGQWLAAALVIAILGAAITLALLGDTEAGAALASATIVGMVAVFVIGRRADKELGEEPPIKSNLLKTGAKSLPRRSTQKSR